MEKKIERYTMYDVDGDKLLLMATEIEDQLNQAGTTEYTVLDCFKMAIELQKVEAINRLREAIENS